MNYEKVYFQIIDRARSRTTDVETYYENHHITPRCMGGDDSEYNIVKLTSREHFICHWLLYKWHRNSKLAHAWFMMSMTSGNQNRYISRNYEYSRIAHSQAVSENTKGEKNSFYGKKHNEDVKKSIGDKNKKRVKTKEEISNWVEKVAKKPKSNEHREKIGRKNLIMLTNINTGESIRIHKLDKHEYDSSIWKDTRSLASLKSWRCEYCGKEGVGTFNYKRWHGENCKGKL